MRARARVTIKSSVYLYDRKTLNTSILFLNSKLALDLNRLVDLFVLLMNNFPLLEFHDDLKTRIFFGPDGSTLSATWWSRAAPAVQILLI